MKYLSPCRRMIMYSSSYFHEGKILLISQFTKLLDVSFAGDTSQDIAELIDEKDSVNDEESSCNRTSEATNNDGSLVDRLDDLMKKTDNMQEKINELVENVAFLNKTQFRDGTVSSTSTTVIPDTASPLPPKHQKKYTLNTDELTYNQAVRACENQSMQLVSIQTKEKNDEINELIQKKGTDEAYWTSGNRIADNNNWVWFNNKTIEYFNWNQGEPNNARKYEFAIKIFKKGADSKWNDDLLELTSSYICESIE
ncbi:hypothetical protein JTB14_014809 [Gonioctena quinquepunctata]|nr:hypothetical protein JTB14_014809 [Gonioctena quinquepunctata]